MVDVSEEIGALMARGEKIAAIKLLRQHTGMGLAEAKQAVEGAAGGAGARPPAGAVRAGQQVLASVARRLFVRIGVTLVVVVAAALLRFALR